MNKLQNRLAKLAEPESTADMLGQQDASQKQPRFFWYFLPWGQSGATVYHWWRTMLALNRLAVS